MLNFLASQFEAGREYHTLNVYRSASFAGIDSQVFKAHSTRGAATSTALRAAIPEIVRIADWTNENTFKKFYYRPVWNARVGHCVLSSAAVEQGT